MYFSISVPRKQMDGRSLLCPFLDTPPKPRFAIGGVLSWSSLVDQDLAAI